MGSKIIRIALGLLVVGILLGGTFSAGLLLGTFLPNQAEAATIPEVLSLPEVSQNDGSEATPSAPVDRETLFKPFWEAWQLVHDQFVDQPVDDLALMRGAIRGMLDALGDQHTAYLDPTEYQQANAPLVGEYDGIGAWVDVDQDYLTIVSPMPDSPAEKAGIKPGDQIIAIDGEDMTGVDGNLALRKVLGPAGTMVVLTIQREELEGPFDVEVVRAKIVLPNIESEMLDNNIAYLRLYTFGNTTARDMLRELRSLMRQNPTGLILDLRNNSGGYLNIAIEVASQFIGDGVIMLEEFGDGEVKTYEAQRGGLATDIPMIVLINEGSASASEIVAGAIQDRGRGQLLGETSYGKGSVQIWTELQDNQGAVRITIARWLTPDRRQIHEVGLEPDVEVPLSEEDFSAERDPQLDKAIELLTQGN